MPRIPGEIVKRALDANANPVSGAKLFVYEAGTTTPITTYSDNALTTPQPFPVIADSSGVFPDIYVASGAIKVNMTTAADAALPGFPVDNLAGIVPQVDGGTGAGSLGAGLVTPTGGAEDSLADHLADLNRRSGPGFATVAAAALVNIDTALETIEVAGVPYSKVSAAKTHPFKFTSANGLVFERTDLVRVNMRRPILIVETGQSNQLGISGGNGGVIDTQPDIWSYERHPTGGQTQGWKGVFKDSVDYVTGQVGNDFGYWFAVRLARSTGRPVCRVKYSIGGKTVDNWIPGVDTNPASSMWINLNSAIGAARTAALPFRSDDATLEDLGITAADILLWHQGESDAATAGALYKRNLLRVLGLMKDPSREGSIAPALLRETGRIIIGEISDPSTNDARNEEIRQIAAECYGVDLALTSDVPLWDGDSPPVHWPAAWLEDVADRYYDARPLDAWEVTIADDALYSWRPSHLSGAYAITDVAGGSRLHFAFGFRATSGNAQVSPWNAEPGLDAISYHDNNDLSTLATVADGAVGIGATKNRLHIRNRRDGTVTLRIAPLTRQPLPGNVAAD